MADQRPDDHRDAGALSHDRPCGHCHHAAHHGVLCGVSCDCTEDY
jgi:hypothetical protein